MATTIGKAIECGINQQVIDELGIKQSLVQDINIRLSNQGFARVSVELIPESPNYLKALFNNHDLMLVKK